MVTRFVENPVTILTKGIILLGIGLSEASRTFLNDLEHGQLRAGHGMIIIGIFNILDSLPHLIDGLDATRRYAEYRTRKAKAKATPPPQSDAPPSSEQEDKIS